jgi:lipopolysaccharide export LptBFGC system permease protein LptF
MKTLMLFQEVDTTSAQYKIGYEIGSWLPFIILAVIFIWMSVAAYRRSKRTE